MMIRVIAIAATALVASQWPSRLQPYCVDRIHASELLAEAREKVSSPDSSHVSWRSEFRIAAARPEQVELITSDSLCVVASHAFASTAAGGSGTPPFQVAVVATPSVYFVELGETAGKRGDAWEVGVFTREWKRRIGYGQGH